MAVSVSKVIAEVRDYVQDTEQPYRYSDADMLLYVNDGLQQMAVLRPDLFTREATITLAADASVRVPAADADRVVRIMELEQAEGSDGVTVTPVEVMKTDMDRCAPGWRNMPRGVCRQWMRDPRVPKDFLVYPPPAAQTVRAIYAVEPQRITSATDTLPGLPDVYQAALVACCVYLASSVDAEHVASGRAERFRTAFREAMGASVEGRLVTDSPDAGEGVIEAAARS